MSDDTPTQRMDEPIDGRKAEPDEDAPTRVLPQTQAAVPAEAGETEGERKSKRLIIILAAVGGALLIALIVLLIVLLTRGGAPAPAPTESPSPTPTATSATPSPTPTASSPTPTPTPTQTEAPPPPPPPPSPITSFTASTTSVDCDGQSSVPVTFSWSATGDTLWFGVGTDNAKDAPYDQFPLNYTMDFDYQCGQSSGQQIYTITVQAGGDLDSETITITE